MSSSPSESYFLDSAPRFDVIDESRNGFLCANYSIKNTSEILSKSKGSAVFLDRDGVINVDYGYVNSMNNVELIYPTLELIRKVNDLRIPVIVITNQAGVAKNKFTEMDLIKFNLDLLTKLASIGCNITFLYYCPSHPDALVKTYKKKCNCRKPGPAMFEWCIYQLNLNPNKCIFIGDQVSDSKAASAAKIKYLHKDVISELGIQKVMELVV